MPFLFGSSSKVILIKVISSLKYYFSIYKMERTEPIDSETKVSPLFKILLYLDVSTYRIVAALPSLSDLNVDYHIRAFSTGIITLIEFTIFRLLFPGLVDKYWKWALVIPFIIHGLLSMIFKKNIKMMSSDYNGYYNSRLFYLFFMFLAVGLVGFFMLFNDSIGK